MTSRPSLQQDQQDLINAGAEWTDQPVVTDHHLVTSRKPDDLHAGLGGQDLAHDLAGKRGVIDHEDADGGDQSSLRLYKKAPARSSHSRSVPKRISDSDAPTRRRPFGRSCVAIVLTTRWMVSSAK